MPKFDPSSSSTVAQGSASRRCHGRGTPILIAATMALATATFAATPPTADASSPEPAPQADGQNRPHIYGHMTPLPEERLNPPERFDCGLEVVEWRAGEQGERERRHIAELCQLARDEFEPFVQRAGYRLAHRRPFHFAFALLPRGNGYRALNDLKWRFRDRASQFPIWGYTDHRNLHVFMLGDQDHREFDVTLLHEQFHAMSYFYGVFDQHRGTHNEKVLADENLARAFTLMLGYGA